MALLMMIQVMPFTAFAENDDKQSVVSDPVSLDSVSVTFMDGETQVALKAVKPGETLTSLPDAPEHDDGDFTGWFDENDSQRTTETVISGNLIVFAKYQAKTVTAVPVSSGVLAVYVNAKYVALTAAAHSQAGRLKAVEITPDENGQIVVRKGSGSTLTVWTLEKIEGTDDKYYVHADNGLYLWVTDTGISVSAEPHFVRVNEEGALVQLKSESGQKAVNLKGNKATNGFQAYTANEELNERFYTIPFIEDDNVNIVFNSNNGQGVDAADPIVGHIGETIQLPACKIGDSSRRFLGWSATRGASDPSQIMAAGSDYTVPDKTSVTLYAIWEGLVRVTLDANNGSEPAPDPLYGKADEAVILPAYAGTREGYKFIGWTDVADLKANTKYHHVYKPGEQYVMPEKNTTLYAAWTTQATGAVQFGIRLNGTIPSEPANYPVTLYSPVHLYYDEGVIEQHWIVDVDSTKPVEGNHIVNDVTANLTYLPNDEEIANVIYPGYDPATQYVHWYVLKWQGGTYWHVDGVIMNRDTVKITYDQNAPEGYVKDCPLGYAVVPGTEVTIGADGAILADEQKGA